MLPQPKIVDDCNGLTPSFQKEVQPIFKKNCAQSGCHDGDNMPADFSVYQELLPVLQDSAVYYYVIKDRTMPQGEILDSASYHLIKCWIKNGFPNN